MDRIKGLLFDGSCAAVYVGRVDKIKWTNYVSSVRFVVKSKLLSIGLIRPMKRDPWARGRERKNIGLRGYKKREN